MSEDEAKKLMKKGKSLCTKSITRWKADWDSAATEYEKAAQIYTHLKKVAEAKDAWYATADAHSHAHNLYLAGKAMEQCAQLQKDTKDADGAAQSYAKASVYFMEDSKPDRQAEALQRAARTIMPISAEQGAAYLEEGLRALEAAEKYHLTTDLFPLLTQCHLKAGKVAEALATLKRHIVALRALDQGKHIARAMLEIIIVCAASGDEVLARRELEECDQLAPEFMRHEEWALAGDLLGALESRDEARLTQVTKDQTLTFLNVEVCRMAKKLKVSGAPPIVHQQHQQEVAEHAEEGSGQPQVPQEDIEPEEDFR
eukprot:PhM_4_TR2366/c0_g2_i1/m.6641/K21198/NAPG, SNAPG; gamma-soluble NSF attachment protein